MSRPGFLLEVEPRTPALLVGDGRAGRLQSFPHGTHVAYPNEDDTVIQDVPAAIAQACAEPKAGQPLGRLLRPGMRLTLVVTGLGAAPMADDIRSRLVTHVLDAAASAGVDDVAVLVAVGLGRRLTRHELRHVLGTRVVSALAPDGLVLQHVLGNTDELVDLEPTAQDEPVSVNRRVAQSDLVVTINVVRHAAEAGAGILAHGVTGADTIDAIRGYQADGGAGDRVASALVAQLPIWSIDVITDQHDHHPRYDYLSTREWEWNTLQRATRLAASRLGAVSPGQLHAMIWESGHARDLAAIHAGDPEPVAQATRGRLAEQQVVQVPAQADAVISHVTPRTPHNAGARPDPLTAAWSALHRFARPGNPLRPFGAVIVSHPLGATFDATMHQAAGDFFHRVLARTTHPGEIHETYERAFATDDWYAHLHRDENAYPGMHPLYLWYDIARAVEHCGDVVWIGANREAASRMGMRAATTLADAREIVADGLDPDAQVLYLHPGATVVTEVTGS